jgi:hypothetical protein
MNAPVLMLTGTAAREDKTTSTVFMELVPAPSEVFTIQQKSTITALFVAECRVSASTQRLEARIMVDDKIADPGSVVLTTTNKYETRCHLGFKTEVSAGSHKVTIHWRVSGGTGFVRNRSLTVWQVC